MSPVSAAAPVSRRALLTATAAGVVTAVASPARATAPAPAPSPRRAVGPWDQFHTVGRVKAAADGAAQYTWPGIYFEARFRGTGVGVALDDYNNDYDIQIDGTTATTLVTPGRTTAWVNGLANTEHRVRLVKRTESPWGAGRFSGFVAASGGAILAKPPARSRQIEFIGDSFTAGYGNVSTTRDCSNNGGVNRNSNAGLAFGSLTAQNFNADYQLNAYSGLGMVRNYNGGNATVDFRTYYDRALLNIDGDIWQKPDTWLPQVVVVGLGINDFSTSLNGGERWTTQDALVAAYESAYHGFLDRLRARYGPSTYIVVSATLLSNTTAFAQAAQRIVQERNRRGDSLVRYWYYDDPGLDRLGCDWHPSLNDHRIVSRLLNSYLATLPLRW
ncbi:SGNH/GDSL hydrolase family protein [Streptomyces sp. NPDC087658]|uniref:SGNH/GDSL hydrolase family protein n=1 Tax=Streptomyces sp. NPDC087658 TaxID=3365800 RepID=UPI0037FC31C2